jgi:hypothetical protein
MRDHWPKWAILAQAAGRCLSAAERTRPRGITRYQRLLLMQVYPVQTWLISELAAEHCDRMAREEWAEVQAETARSES